MGAGKGERNAELGGIEGRSRRSRWQGYAVDWRGPSPSHTPGRITSESTDYSNLRVRFLTFQ